MRPDEVKKAFWEFLCSNVSHKQPFQRRHTGWVCHGIPTYY